MRSPKTNSKKDTCSKFVDAVKRLSYKGKAQSPFSLSNITFLAGAGFSKAWEPSSPIGNELFTLNEDLIEDFATEFGIYMHLKYRRELNPQQMRELIYELDLYDKFPLLRRRYLDSQNIDEIRKYLRALTIENYSQIVPPTYFDPSLNKFPIGSNNITDKKVILKFFRYLLDQITGSGLEAEGLRLHFVTTNYDFIIETVLDNCIGPDDSLFLYTYRGITPRNVAGFRNPTPLHSHWLNNHLLKLNGRFEIVRENSEYSLIYTEREKTTIRNNPPLLILPSREQDYSDPYFLEVFPKVVRLARETDIFVIVGYSFPQDDALIRYIVRQIAEEPEDAVGKWLFYIDLNNDAVKRDRLTEIFPWWEELNTAPQIYLFQGGFVDFARGVVSLA